MGGSWGVGRRTSPELRSMKPPAANGNVKPPKRTHPTPLTCPNFARRTEAFPQRQTQQQPLVLLLLLGVVAPWACARAGGGPLTPSAQPSQLTCAAEADFSGQTLQGRDWLQTRDSSNQPALTPAPLIPRKFASQLGGTRACPPGLDDANHFGTSVVPRRAKYYELRNFCIGPFFQGGVTVYRPKNWRGKRLRLKAGLTLRRSKNWRGKFKEGGLELCNEFRCAAYPVSANKKTFPCHRAKWVTDASAVVLPLTNGNPWHFMHHLLPLTQVLDENERSIRNATVHLYTTLFSRPTPPPTGFPLLQRAKRWHPFPARTYFSTWRFRWWPLLAAAMPPSLRMAQVDHLELLNDDPEFRDTSKVNTVCYTHGFLGVPPAYHQQTTRRPQPLVPLQHIAHFRRRAFLLAGATPPPDTGRCKDAGSRRAKGAKPLMGLIVRRGTRKLCNLKEVAEEGARVGFRVELVAFEEMDIYEQIKATTRFHFFVAVHGAAMTNVFWLARGATVLEMYPAWPNEPLQEGTDVNPGSNYGRFAALSGARHVVWVQKSLPKEASNVPFRKVDVTMDLVHFRLVAENAYKAWQASNCS